VLGLVAGPGAVLGVGLVVLGVSVPMPPAGEPEDAPPEEVPDEAPPGAPVDEPEGISDELPPEDVPPDVPFVGVEELPVELVPVPSPFSDPEPPPVMPAHALSSTTQAIGNVHFIINYSRKFQKAARAAARTGGLQCKCRE
jgi:hypothetical protein